jgi:hypothetical protein
MKFLATNPTAINAAGTGATNTPAHGGTDVLVGSGMIG